jgi:transcriptional regulator with XRE-family HTH domain
MGLTISLTSGQALKAVREITGLSLRDFAAKVGSSFGSLQMAETDNRKLTIKLAKKISAFAGCDPESLLRGEILNRAGALFTAQSFEGWSSACLKPGEIDKAVSLMKRSIETFIGVAAIDSASEAHPHRFRQITAKISMAMDDLLKEYSLVDSFNARLAEAVIPGEWHRQTLGQCRTQFNLICEWRNWDSSANADDFEVQIRRTVYPLWQPPYSSWLGAGFATPEAIIEKFKVRLELSAPWIQGRREISWTEWQLERTGEVPAARFYFNPEDKIFIHLQ